MIKLSKITSVCNCLIKKAKVFENSELINEFNYIPTEIFKEKIKIYNKYSINIYTKDIQIMIIRNNIQDKIWDNILHD